GSTCLLFGNASGILSGKSNRSNSVRLHYFAGVTSPFAHATTASNANPDRHNGLAAGSNERVGWKIERGRLHVFTGNAQRARLLRRPINSLHPLFCAMRETE